MSQLEPDTNAGNDVPFAALPNHDTQDAVRESANIPNFHGDEPTVANNRAGMTSAPNQSTPQTFTQEALGMNTEINSTDTGNSGILNSNIEMAKTDSKNTNVAGVIITVSKKQQKKKIKGSTRKRFERLIKEGIPHEEARGLCRLPWIILEKMLLNKTHKIWYNNSGDLQGPPKKYVKVSTEIDEQYSDIGPAALNIPGFQGDKATVSQNKGGLRKAPKQSKPQTSSKKALSMGMNNGINSTEARNSGMLKSNIELAKTDGMNKNIVETTSTEDDWSCRKLSRISRKRYKLTEQGIPQDEARKLCRKPCSTLEEMFLNYKRKRKHSEEPQGPANKLKVSAGIDKQNSDVGTRNSVRAALNIPGFQGDKATVSQNKGGLRKAPNQSAPQTSSKESLSMGMNNGMNSTEARNSGILNSNIELAKTDGMNTNVVETTSTEDGWSWGQLSRVSRKRYHKLTERGIPRDEARKLCSKPLSTLEEMFLNYNRKRKHSEEPRGSASHLKVNSDEVPVREASNIPGFQGDKATVTENRAGLIKAPNQSTPQTFSKEALCIGMNNGINSTVARNSGMLNNNIELDTQYNWNWKKLSQKARKRYHRLKKEGIPQDEARKLCKLPSNTLEEILLNYPRKRSISEDPQGPANKILKISTDENSDVPLRVGIVNSIPMSEDQMKMLHQHLLLAITEQWRRMDEEGPDFLGYSYKAGWFLVTCSNQYSKDWLVHEVLYLQPWPEAQLSIIPEKELPTPPTAVTLIPEAEAASVEEAMTLLKAQNEGLNTELWKVRFENVENGVRKLSFTIDDPSADVLRAQNCQAAINFTMVSFKIKGQYKPYPKDLTRSQVLATPIQSAVPGSSSKPQGSQSLGGKSSDQATSKVGPLSAARESQLPRATGRVGRPIPHPDCQPSAERTPFAQGSSGGTSWEPAALATVGRSVPQTRGEIRALPIIKDSQGHGTFAQKDQRGSMIVEPSTSARGRLPRAARGRAVQPIQNSQIGTPFTQGSGSAGEAVFGLDGSVLATRRSSQRESLMPLFCPSQAPGGMYQTRNNSPNHGGTISFNKRGTTTVGYDQGNLGELTVTDNEPASELSPDEEGGYHSWVIEDLESFGNRFTQNIPGTGTLSPATGPTLATYRDQSTGVPANPEITLDRGLLPQAWDGYGDMMIESESHGNPFLNEQESRRWGLLPLTRGDFERIELENHGPFQASKGIDRESMPGRGSHKARSFGAGVQKHKRRPFQSRGKLADRESRPRLPHPSGFQSQPIESESHGRSFHASRRVANRDSRSNRVLSSRASCYQGQDQSRERLFRGGRTGRVPRSDRRSPHARRGYDASSIDNTESRGVGRNWNGSSTARVREDRTPLSGRMRRRPLALASDSGTVEQGPPR